MSIFEAFICVILGICTISILVVIVFEVFLNKHSYFNNKTFWLNIYRSNDGFLFSDRLLCDTKREAIFDAGGRKDYVKTIKIKL